mmetsp:Transcript_2698/g.9816  ORF Transcript_2698/g.9816 Transcript_2698/m.9816 type:complete len:449 (-) Transcript_2698:1720-3066(-)
MWSHHKGFANAGINDFVPTSWQTTPGPGEYLGQDLPLEKKEFADHLSPGFMATAPARKDPPPSTWKPSINGGGGEPYLDEFGGDARTNPDWTGAKDRRENHGTITNDYCRPSSAFASRTARHDASSPLPQPSVFKDLPDEAWQRTRHGWRKTPEHPYFEPPPVSTSVGAVEDDDEASTSAMHTTQSRPHSALDSRAETLYSSRSNLSSRASAFLKEEREASAWGIDYDAAGIPSNRSPSRSSFLSGTQRGRMPEWMRGHPTQDITEHIGVPGPATYSPYDPLRPELSRSRIPSPLLRSGGKPGRALASVDGKENDDRPMLEVERSHQLIESHGAVLRDSERKLSSLNSGTGRSDPTKRVFRAQKWREKLPPKPSARPAVWESGAGGVSRLPYERLINAATETVKAALEEPSDAQLSEHAKFQSAVLMWLREGKLPEDLQESPTDSGIQ